jgi:orotidine-5'-phosphate decarboxylase
MTSTAAHRLIVSLDVETLDQAVRLIDLLSPVVHYFKIGSIPFFRFGHELIHYLSSRDKRVFLDLKWHDIPNTVHGAVKAASENPAIFMMNVHCLGGELMLKAAVNALGGDHHPLLIGVTLLTSLEQADILKLGWSASIIEVTMMLANMAKQNGLQGVVASAHEAAALKKMMGQDFIVVTPGIRSACSVKQDDQARILTAKEALNRGADYLVVGRPIIAHVNPLDAAKKILHEMNETIS